MKYMGDMLLTLNPFSEIVMGNTALVRAMIESGTRVVTSYPGSPTPEIAEAIKSIPKDRRPFYFEFSTNEKVATEVAYGAAVNGHLSTVFFKSVGLNVAADCFVQLSMMNIIGGMVVVLGDDPGANSSQNEQDNRHLARLCYTPVFEPATPTEVYRFYKEAALISRQMAMPIILRLTTHVCHAKERVVFDEWLPEEWDRTPRFDPRNGPYIPIAAEVFPLKRKALKRLSDVETLESAASLNPIIDNANTELGIITAGMPFLSVMDILSDVPDKPDILKLGMIYPLPRKLIRHFLKTHSEIRIIEELDDILEKDIKSLAFDEGIPVRIIGKMDAEDWVGEYTPDKVHALLSGTWPELIPPHRPSAAPKPTFPADRPRCARAAAIAVHFTPLKKP